MEIMTDTEADLQKEEETVVVLLPIGVIGKIWNCRTWKTEHQADY
jgi:hypothetical protein